MGKFVTARNEMRCAVLYDMDSGIYRLSQETGSSKDCYVTTQERDFEPDCIWSKDL